MRSSVRLVPRLEEGPGTIVKTQVITLGLKGSFVLNQSSVCRGVLKCQNMRLMGTGESRLEQLVGACQETVNFSKR